MRHADVTQRIELVWSKELTWKSRYLQTKVALKTSLTISCKTPFIANTWVYFITFIGYLRDMICEQIHVITAPPFAVRTARLPWLRVSGCPSFLKPRRAKHCCALLLVATLSLINIPDLQIVARNINMCDCDKADGRHAFKYHAHNQRQAAHCSEMEATRKQKIDQTCWFNW